MNYISIEEFERQPDKVKKAIIDSLELDEYDLMASKYKYGTYEEIEVCMVKDIKAENREYSVPLLQIHQLINFIESKVGSKIESSYYDCLWKYQITFTQNTKIIRTHQDDFLQALWEVACKISIEE